MKFYDVLPDGRIVMHVGGEDVERGCYFSSDISLWQIILIIIVALFDIAKEEIYERLLRS
jgi:hypothetical protein